LAGRNPRHRVGARRLALDPRRAQPQGAGTRASHRRGGGLPALRGRAAIRYPARTDRKASVVSWQFLLDQFATQFGLWWVIWPAILLGIVVGILPGFSPQNTLIILLPLTLAVPVEPQMAFMIALYCATHLAGGIPAILVRIPGSGGAAATTLDGYPMTQKGQEPHDLGLGFRAAVVC